MTNGDEAGLPAEAPAGDAILRGAIDELANQLCQAVDGDFDFAVRAGIEDETLEKLSMLTNFVLDTARRGMTALRDHNEALAQLDQAKTTFFTNVSHEFRTPLTLILGPAADALNDSNEPLSPHQRSRLETIHQSSERLLKLVNTLLDFSRLESRRTEARLEAVDLAAETLQIAEMFRSAVEHAGLGFVVDCPPIDMPIGVDREMWAKIVSNLLSNALKFTFDGKISVRLARDGDTVQLAVADTGIGIETEHQPHLFERFHRIEGARSRTFEGSGIGLALVAELVDLHGGSIRVDSAAGEGSTFTVRLPVRAVGPGAPAVQSRSEHVVSSYVAEALRWVAPNDAARAATGVAATTKDLRPTVLVADDNQDMRRYIAELLSPSYDVVTAEDGAVALEAVRAVHPDLVLSDVMMPNLNGFELVQALRGDPATAGTPVILLSARAGEESAVEGLEAGADDYLVKPFSAVELLARVRSNLELERSRRAAARREHEIAVELQERLVPTGAPRLSMFEIATYYEPGVLGAQVGGDWFETIDLGRERAALVVGDVMGKGIQAAATMGQLRSIVSAYAGLDMSPGDLLEAVDARVRESGTEQIASCIYAAVDGRSLSLEFANAGHLPPLLVAGGEVSRLDSPLGPPLGAGPAAFRQGHVQLEPGSMLVLYTDGLVETRTGYTDERIDLVGEIARSWDGEIDGLPAALASELCPTGSSDDVAILVARLLPLTHAPTSETSVQADVAGPPSARQFTREILAQWALPSALPNLVLLVSELVTNAVVHGRPPIRLRLTNLGDEVLIEVDDALADLPSRQRPSANAESGRGLHIMAALSHRTGVSLQPNGKTVWCTVPVAPP